MNVESILKGTMAADGDDKLKNGLVLVDDDPHFCQLFKKVAEIEGLKVTCFASLLEMSSFAHLKDYDAAILDYQLDNLRGTEIAEYVDAFFPNLPVFLISADEKAARSKAWPASIRSFFSKSSGVREIINGVTRELSQIDYYKQLSERTKLDALYS